MRSHALTLCEYVYGALGYLQTEYGERPAHAKTYGYKAPGSLRAEPRTQQVPARKAAPWYPAAMVACFEGAGNAFVLDTAWDDWAEQCASEARNAHDHAVLLAISHHGR